MAQLVVEKKIKGGVIYKDFFMRLDNVRVSFPHLARAYRGPNAKEGDKGSFGVVAMLEEGRQDTLIDAVNDQISKLMKLKEAGKISSEKRFFRDGNDDANEEYAGHWIASARESKRKNFTVRDVDGNILDPVEDVDMIEEMIYGGCYCDVLIRIWYQDGVTVGKGYGKRINAGLVGIKFRDDGEPFGEGRIDDGAAWSDDDDDDDKSSRSSRRSRDDDDDDKPSRSSRRSRDDDDDDKPSRSSRRSRDDDDDDDDKPSRSSRRRPADDEDDDL